MNIHELREAQIRFENRKEEVKEARKELHRLRNSFARYFNRNRIRSMSIYEYAIGNDLPEKGYNFCYTLERQLDGLGRIIGATAFKFGVYYGRTRSDATYKYRFTNKFGETYKEAFTEVKQSLLQLLDAGQDENIDAIAGNLFSPMFKGKILSTYFPERYLNVFSWDHLNYFLVQLDLDTDELIWSDAVYKREALIRFKNQDPVMKHWSVDLFAHFLYTEYPGRPPKGTSGNQEKDPLADYRPPDFPPNPTAEFIDLNILPPSDSSPSGNRKGSGKVGNTDYEKEARRRKKLGDRGEKIVLDMEKTRLKAAGKNKLANKVKRVSLESDWYGYDILSYNEDGSERLIEVKATASKVGAANFFFTANELKIALKNRNYFIYMVYDILSSNPKVWIIENPFLPENKNVVKTPINYRVVIKTSRK